MQNTWPEEKEEVKENIKEAIASIERGDPVMAAEVAVETAVELVDDGIRLATGKQPADE